MFDLQKQLVNYSAVSPQASAMMERIKCPVDYNTGAVNVSIPLYEIKIRDLALPIVLKCKTTGIKTTEDSSCVGLGWSLQAEPMISREVKGKPDERFYTTYNPNFGSRDIMYLEKVYYGDSYDEEPDIFYYSNLNNSGQFVLKRPQSYTDPKYNPVLIPAGPETFIKSDFNSGGFRMKDAKGNLYYYGDDHTYTEYTSNTSGDNPATCWKASRIVSPRNDTISFTYTSGRSARYPANLDYYGVEDMDGTFREHGAVIPTSGGYWKGVNNNLDYYYANGVKYGGSKNYAEEFLLEPYIRNLGYGAVTSTVGTEILNTITYPNGKIVFSSTSGRITSMQIY